MNRGNNSSFLSQTQREPGQDLAPLPMRGCPSSSPCSGCLGVSVGFNQLQFGHFSPCRMAGLDFSRYKTVRSLHTPMAGVAWREGPCLAFAGRGDTRRFVECMVTHWGCSSVDEERRVQASAPCTAATLLHSLALCRCPLPPQALLGTGTIVTHFSSHPLLWEQGHSEVISPVPWVLATSWPKEEQCWLQEPLEVHPAPSDCSDISAEELAAAETHSGSAGSSSQLGSRHLCFTAVCKPSPCHSCSVPRHSWDCASWRLSASNLLLPSQDLMVLQQTQCLLVPHLSAAWISCAVKGLQMLPAELALPGLGEDWSGLN